MFDKLQNPLVLVGRVLLALMFITSGFGKLMGFDGTVGYIASKDLPMASLFAVIAIVAELGGGLAVAFGFLTRWAALGLAVFTVVAGVLFHNYWAVPADEVMMQQINFWKNISIAGGFLAIAAFGAGAFSLDALLGRASSLPGGQGRHLHA